MSGGMPAPAAAPAKPTKLRGLSEKGKALWILAMLSPVLAELCSGSSPPLEFFNPISFALLLGLYGAGVLVVRELSVVWGKGWASVLVMGAAYGILEEGVAVKSFFDPQWMDLGGLGEYGRFLDTNWVWAVWLTIYHTVISITLPILIIYMLYPHLRKERFLSRGRFEAVLVILFIDVLVCTALLNDYVPSIPMYILSIAAVFGLVLYAKHLPSSFLRPTKPHPVWSPRRLAVLAFLFIFLSFIFAGAFVDTSVPALVPIVLLLGLSGFALVAIVEHIGSSNNLPQIAGLAGGLMGFLVVFGSLQELSGSLGMSIVALVTALFAIDLFRWTSGKRVFVFHVARFIYGDSRRRRKSMQA